MSCQIPAPSDASRTRVSRGDGEREKARALVQSTCCVVSHSALAFTAEGTRLRSRCLCKFKATSKLRAHRYQSSTLKLRVYRYQRSCNPSGAPLYAHTLTCSTSAALKHRAYRYQRSYAEGRSIQPDSDSLGASRTPASSGLWIEPLVSVIRLSSISSLQKRSRRRCARPVDNTCCHTAWQNRTVLAFCNVETAEDVHASGTSMGGCRLVTVWYG